MSEPDKSLPNPELAPEFEPDADHIAERADLLPEEEQAGSDDPLAQAEAVLTDSAERTEYSEQDR